MSADLEERLAGIALSSLKDAAGELRCGDPESMLRALSSIQGSVTTLRAYAKRQIANRVTEAAQ